MTDYQKLANEVAHITKRHLPKTPAIVRRKPSPSDSPQRRRSRYLKMRKNRIRSPYSLKYGTVGIKLLFPAIAEALAISEDNARVRYYRGQVPTGVLVKLKRQCGIKEQTRA